MNEQLKTAYEQLQDAANALVVAGGGDDQSSDDARAIGHTIHAALMMLAGERDYDLGVELGFAEYKNGPEPEAMLDFCNELHESISAWHSIES